jgi:hypothetical protein
MLPQGRKVPRETATVSRLRSEGRPTLRSHRAKAVDMASNRQAASVHTGRSGLPGSVSMIEHTSVAVADAGHSLLALRERAALRSARSMQVLRKPVVGIGNEAPGLCNAAGDAPRRCPVHHWAAFLVGPDGGRLATVFRESKGSRGSPVCCEAPARRWRGGGCGVTRWQRVRLQGAPIRRAALVVHYGWIAWFHVEHARQAGIRWPGPDSVRLPPPLASHRRQEPQ